MHKILVTGGLGFIGSNLIRLLLKKKFKVCNIDNLSYSAQKYNLKDIRSKNYLFKKIDINNRKEVSKILKKYKPHGIFNLAADTHVDRSIDDSFNFMKNNILGVYNLLESIKDYKKKIFRKSRTKKRIKRKSKSRKKILRRNSKKNRKNPENNSEKELIFKTKPE